MRCIVQILFGCAAFAFFFLGDFNDWRMEKPILRLCFPIGFILLAYATASEIIDRGGLRDSIFLLTAAIFLGLLIYTLFFAFNSKEAYHTQEKGRPVYTTGVYGICRHPGVLWFAGIYLSLWLMGGVSFISAVVYTALNVILVWFEDVYVFPATMDGYEKYKTKVPFLIPMIHFRRTALSGN